MRILIVNSYEYPSNLCADSSYTLTRRLIEFLPKDFFFLWVLPDMSKTGRYRWRTHGSLELPKNCKPIYIPMQNSRIFSELMVSEELFERINIGCGTDVDYDIILCNNGAVAQRVFELTRGIKGNILDGPPVVVVDYSTPFLGNLCEQGNLKNDKGRILNHYLGYVNASSVLFFTGWCKKQAIRQARELFSISTVRDLDKKSMIVPQLFSRAAVAKAKAKKRKRFTVYWGGRLTESKRVKLALEVYDYLFSLGGKIDMVATIPYEIVNPNKVQVGKHKHFPSGLELHKKLSQADAWKVMASCHISIFPQSMRFAPAAPMEQLSAGLIVLLNRVDSTTIIPEDYPWYWETPLELHVLLKHVYENYDEEMKKQKKWKKFADEHLSIESQSHVLGDAMRSLVLGQNEIVSHCKSLLLTERVNDIVEGEEWYSFRGRLLKENKVYSQLLHSSVPHHLNPSIWLAYKALSVFAHVVDTREEPVLMKRR